MDFVKKLKEDKVFLLALIDDPVKAFRAYGFNGNDELMSMLNTSAANVRERAIAIFSELCPVDKMTNGCDGCRGCKACEMCSM